MKPGDYEEKKAGARKLRRIAVVSLVAVVLFVWLVALKPSMPDRISILTGPEGSAYHDLGLRYAAEITKRGLATEVVITSGGLDNLERLVAGAEDAVAFAPTSLDTQLGPDVDTSRIEALGNVEFEPLWLFFRKGLEIERIPDLARRVVATGGEGAVGQHLATVLLHYNGIAGEVQLRSFPDSLRGANSGDFTRDDSGGCSRPRA